MANTHGPVPTGTGPQPRVRRLWVGTYPAPGAEPGSGEGIWDVGLDVEQGRFTPGRLVQPALSPSFVALAPDERTLYAVGEVADGRVAAFRVEAGSELGSGPGLTPIGDRPSLGADPCHVVAGNDALWVANYSSGTFTTIPVRPGGALGEPVAHEGSGTGPVTDRQEGPHAHFAAATPDGAAVWVSDLGADLVRRYTVTDGGVDDAGTAVQLPPGTGPRHLVFGRAGTPAAGAAFVVGELDAQVHVLATGTASEQLLSAEPVASVPTCTTPWAGGAPAPSHVDLSADGTRLYVAVRGPDVLATFAIEPDASSGAGVCLVHLADSPLAGVWPRHFAVLATGAGDVVVVAGQNWSTLEALRVRAEDGSAEPVDVLDLPSPACVVERRILEG